MMQSTHYGQVSSNPLDSQVERAKTAAFRTANGSLFLLTVGLENKRLAGESIDAFYYATKELISPANMQERLDRILLKMHQQLIASGSAGVAGKRPRVGMAMLFVTDYATFFFESGGCQLALYRFGKALKQPDEDNRLAMGDPGFSPTVKALPYGLLNQDTFLLSSPDFWAVTKKQPLEQILMDNTLSEQDKAEKLAAEYHTEQAKKECALIVTSVQNQSQFSQIPQENMQTTTEKPPNTNTTSAPSSRFSWITFVTFLVFAGLVAYLYHYNEQKWAGKIEENARELDSLQLLTAEYQERLQLLDEKEAQRSEIISEFRFDPFDSENFRIYGLFRDVEKKYSKLDVALMFNISNANSLKVSEVVGERWFIVPIKGVHFFFRGESLTEIARKYYEDPADSVLIDKFNLDPEPGSRLFIPFGKQ